jgi:hypothetical protein
MIKSASKAEAVFIVAPPPPPWNMTEGDIKSKKNEKIAGDPVVCSYKGLAIQ